MDEPLSNLDAKLRVQVRAQISQLQSDLGVTTIYVTHDQVEAMTMGDRVAVMRKGRLQQVASPAGGLRPPGQPVRGRVHRQPGDEHPRGPRRGDRGRALRGPRRPAPGHRAPAAWRSARGSGSTWAMRWCWASAPRAWRTRRSRRRAPEDRRLRGTVRAARGARLGDRRLRAGPGRRAGRHRRRGRARGGRRGRGGPARVRPRRRRRAGRAAGRALGGRGGRRHRAGGRQRRVPLLRPGLRARGLRRTTETWGGAR